MTSHGEMQLKYGWRENDGSGWRWRERSAMCGRGVGDMVDWKIRDGWRIQASRELAPSAIIGYKHIRMEGEKRDARFGRERRDVWFGGDRRDAWCWRFGVIRGFRRPGSLPLQPSSGIYTYI